MTELQQYLDQVGFTERPSQTKLYEHLILADKTGVVSQAGTGTGKSAAVIAAAAHQSRLHGSQSIIVTPTLTLMNQYRDGDIPVAEKAYPDLAIAEVRGMIHYICEQTRLGLEGLGLEYSGGCGGFDAGCSQKGFEGHDGGCGPGCQERHEWRWACGYREARFNATRANIVVTNADMLIVNDRTLYPLGAEFLSLDGALYVDEAHTLEQKFRDYASRSLFFKSVERFKFAGTAGPRLAKWIESQDRNLSIKDVRGFPSDALLAIANADVPDPHPNDGLTKQRETQEACARIVAYMNDPHESAVLHVGQGSLKMDWINVAKSSGELLTQRRFGLVSATVPDTMAASLGVPDAPFIDVGHPFDYGSQAWIGFSPYGGDFKSAQHESNLERRTNEVVDIIRRSKGGALILFSSFRDMEAVSAKVIPQIRDVVGECMIQDRDGDASDRQILADRFKADGNAVLFGSESFATGFDVPGDALRLVVIWKLPYPAVDPVSNAIRASSYARYEDLMKVRAVQAIGRLIRRDTDRGVVWMADSRARKLLNRSDPLTSHLPEFARL